MRILVHADFGVSTGFGNVAHNIVKQLMKDGHQFHVLAINYHGQPTEWQRFYPHVQLYPAKRMQDVYGRDVVVGMLREGDYDVFLQIQDTFIIEPVAKEILHHKHRTKWIYYFPIDSPPKKSWIRAASYADIPVAYCQYGYDESINQYPPIQSKLKVIPHGTDTDVFKPLPADEAKEFREAYFTDHADRFIITNVNRNQPRKDLPRSLQLIKLIRQEKPEAILYLHCREEDLGGNIHEYADAIGAKFGEDYIMPNGLRESNVDTTLMNLIYNASDVLVTTANGEGWGLSLTEAMATKLPVYASDHSSIHDILLDNRGVLIPTEDVYFMAHDNERPRMRTNIQSMAKAIVAGQMPDVEKAYEHVTKEWNWDRIGNAWRELVK